MAQLVEVKVPDIGDFKDVEVIELLVKVGDTIKVDQSLVTVESDKASMEIPSSHAGVVKEVLVKVGDTVNQGTPRMGIAGLRNAPLLTPPSTRIFRGRQAQRIHKLSGIIISWQVASSATVVTATVNWECWMRTTG